MGQENTLQELYQQVILDHNKNPHNFRSVPEATHKANGFNPLCGDKYVITFKLSSDGKIEDAGFEGSGCAISKASASLMTDMIKGKTEQQARELIKTFYDMITGTHVDLKAVPTKLKVLAGVKQFPARVKCASLAWHTAEAALDRLQETTTE